MKRWIIHSFFIALLLLFVGGWVRSYWYEDGIVWRTSQGYGFSLNSFNGSIYVVEFASLGSPFLEHYSRAAEDEVEIPAFIYDFSFVGFDYSSDRIITPGGPQWAIGIPF